MLSIPCKTGSIKVTDDGMIRVVQPFGKVLWQSRCEDVSGFTVQPSLMMMVTLTIHAPTGNYTAETVTKQNAEKLQALFPNIQAHAAGREWYCNPTALTHVATYTKERDMQREVETAAQFGWVPQAQSAQAGHSSAAKVIGGALLAGPVGALAGAVSKSKGKITVTFVRSAEWVAQHP